MTKPLLLLLLLAGLAFAADLHFSWDPNDPAEEIIAYRLYTATNVSGPFALAAVTTNGTQTNLVLTNALRGQAFYYLKAENFWTNSDPSVIVSTPKLASPVGQTTIRLIPP